MGRPPLVSRETIILAAREVFQREGLGASIRDIAAIAGISESAIFKRFSTKAALIVAALAPPAPPVAEILAPLDDEEDLRSGLTLAMHKIVEHFRIALPMILPVIAQPDVGLDGFLTELADNPATVLNSALAARLTGLANDRLIRVPQPFAVAGLIVATAHSLVLFEIMGLHGGRSPPAVIDAMVETIWNGIAPR